jgi:DNA invertase Pin-like site-specific DNA recombinase
MQTVRVGIWVRVSTIEQQHANQVPEIEKYIADHGYQLAKRYELNDSAWNGGRELGEYRANLDQALNDALARKFSLLVVWSLDRISRGGAEDALRIIRLFRERGCSVVSVKESWLTGSPEIQDVLVAFAGWLAQQESNRRSERIKAAIQQRKDAGTWVGRGRDKRRRSRVGYFRREARKRELTRPAG